MRAPSLLIAILAASMSGELAGAQDAQQAEQQADVVSEIGLARCAEELGDAGLAARLALTPADYQTLVAVRASAHAQVPEALVPALAELACGRHPLFAPEAAFALSRIAERLRPSELAARESLRSDLQRAHDALQCVRRAPLPRPDIAHSVAQLHAALSASLR